MKVLRLVFKKIPVYQLHKTQPDRFIGLIPTKFFKLICSIVRYRVLLRVRKST